MRKELTWTAFAAVAISLTVAGRMPAFAQSSAQAPAAAADTNRRTIWSGVYTDDQAARGVQAYMANCSFCHGMDLEGVAHLKGDDFMERWREFDVKSLYDFISTSMPRRRQGSPNSPGSLSQDTYVDIIAHIFRSNGFPSGRDDLKIGGMKSIQIEGKEGPKPVPNGALVQLIGCLTLRGADWVLTAASEPARTSVSATSTDEEMQRAKTKDFGDLQFLLQNLGYLGNDFDPASLTRQKVQTKGYVVRQTGRNRIDVTSITPTGALCQ